MSHDTFNLQWQEAMLSLMELLKIEFPTDISQWPMTLAQWSKIYVTYIQVYRKLEDSYDQIVHPQKRRDAKKALEACIGRMLEIKGWMVGLNNKKEYFNFDDILIEMGLPPDALDICPPHYLTIDRASFLAAREAFLKHEIQVAADERAAAAAIIAAEEKAAKEFQDRKMRRDALEPPPPMTEDEAVMMLQAEERGRQGRTRIVEMIKIKAMQELELEKQRSGIRPHNKDSATFFLQRICRGFLQRLGTEAACIDEMTLIHMNNNIPPDPKDPRIAMQQNVERRRKVQIENKQEEEDNIVATKEKIKEMEGQEMREIMQERINVWLNENRDPDTNFYPAFPKPTAGGSKDIIDPPPALWRPEDEKKKKGDGKDNGRKKKGKGGIRMPEPDEDKEQVPMCPNVFARHVKAACQAYVKTWYDKDDYDNYQQKYVPEILKNTLRPLIFEEMRLEVDIGSREILAQLKKKLAQDKKDAIKLALKQAKKEGKEKELKAKIKAEKQQAKKDKVAKMKAKKDADSKAPPPPPDHTKKKPKRKKDLTEKRSVESIYIELVKEGIMQVCPNRNFDEFLAQEQLRGTNFDAIQLWEMDNSMAQAKRLVIEYGLLPLASELVNGNAPFIRSLLLHGGPQTGKSLLAHAICKAAGALFINLSADVIDGKYEGKQIVMLLHMCFKLAKIMSPAVIYIDKVDQIFVTDKKIIKTYGLKDKPNRIKKPLMKELSALHPGECVLLIGTTSNPQDLQSKKGPNKITKDVCKSFSKRVYCPYPDYGARLVLWRGLIERHGGIVTHHFNVSTLATLTKDYSVGAIEDVVKLVLTPQHVRKVRRIDLVPEEFVEHLFKFKPIEEPLHFMCRHWAKDPKPVIEDEEEVKKGGAGKTDAKKKK